MSRARVSEPSEPPPAKLVLIISSQPDVRSLLSEYVLSLSLVPVPASGGAQAEVVCQAFAPALVLVDVPLPDTDAATLIRRVKARRPEIATVICTRSDPEREARYRAEGADEIVAKPLNLLHIGRALSRLTSASTPT